MTSTAKTAYDFDKSALVQGESADAGDVTAAILDAETAVADAEQTVSVTASDTHKKNLDDAIDAGTGLTKSVVNPGADEMLRLAVNGGTISDLNASTAFDTGTVPHERGGLEADVSSYSGLLKINAGATSQATSGADYTSPAGTENLTNKTLDNTNDIDLGAIDPTNAAGASAGDVLTWGGTAYGPAPAGGGGAQPIDVTGTAGEAIGQRDFVYLNDSDGQWYEIDIDASPPKIGRIRGVVIESGGIGSGASGNIRIFGDVSGFTGLTAWEPIYASTTPGSYTQTRPDPTEGGVQVAIAEIGFAVSATQIHVDPQPVQYMKRATVANDGSLTVEHHADAMGYLRRVTAYISSDVAGATLATYASSNQDGDQALSDRAVATYTTDQCTGGTASASAQDGGREASKAFDNGADEWSSGSNTTGWLEYDFGTNKTIRRYTLTSFFATFTPRDWTIEYYDGAAWQVADTVTGETGWTNGETRTYDIDADHTASRWRINISQNNGGGGVGLEEMEMFEVATYTNGDARLAQSFQVTGAQTIASVDLWLRKVGSPTGNLTVKIETDSGGSPSGTVVANGTSDTVAESSIGTSYESVTFSFSTPPSLSGSTTYWLVLETSRSPAEFDYIEWGIDSSTPGYADGQLSTYSGSWSSVGSDAIFTVYAVGTSFEEPAVMGRWSGGTRDIAIRYDDGADGNPQTRTTFKNVTGSSADMTAVVELN